MTRCASAPTSWLRCSGLHPAIGAELLPALLAGQLPPQAALVTTLLNDLDAALGDKPFGSSETRRVWRSPRLRP